MKIKPPAPPEPPSPPLTPGPPLPILIPGVNVLIEPPKQRRSLYQNVMGDDLSLLYAALDASWSSPDMKELAMGITSGERSIDNLSTTDLELLDSMAMAYSGGDYEKMRQAQLQRLPTQTTDRAQDEDGEGDGDGGDSDVRPYGGSELQGDGGDGSPDSAYSWLKEDG